MPPEQQRRKRCPKCRTVFMGPGVEETYSCDVCGNGYLTDQGTVSVDVESSKPLPRSGGGGAITHTRDGF